MKIVSIILINILLFPFSSNGQTTITVYPDSLSGPVNINFTPGVFFAPKTSQALNDFMNNGIHQNAIRTNAIEWILNTTSNLDECLAKLNTYETYFRDLSAKCDKLFFVFEKMPPWLSSSDDWSPAGTPGWVVLNTKPPADWNEWQTVVDSMVTKIVVQFDIQNAWFEVWNEPDIGSWTGTMGEYFELYKRTYTGVKSSVTGNRVGGPSVNFWTNNIYWKPWYGYVSDEKADSSLIGQLLDSVAVWDMVPDFISWHNFNISWMVNGYAEQYIEQKLESLSLPDIPLVITEWNASYTVRDTPLARSITVNFLLADFADASQQVAGNGQRIAA